MPLFKKAVFLSLILMVQSGSGIFGAAVALDTRYAGTIQQGVTINGIPLGGLNQADAAQKLEISLPAPTGLSLEIKDAGKSYVVKLSDIDGRYDYQAMAEKAINYGKKGTDINQLVSILRLRSETTDLTVNFAFSGEKLAERIKNLQGEWEARPKDAEVRLSNEKIVVLDEKAGYSLNYEKTLEQARRALAGGETHASGVGRVLEPKITSADLKGMSALLAQYITTFDESAANRSHNIALASAAINGSLLKPGEMFSLNQRLGPRLAETGYLKAPVFVNDRLTQDIGGGVCQVASTLYNAVLLSDLTVVERSSHGLPVNYVSPGRDATIAGDYLDLKFANNMDTPVYISSIIQSGVLTVRIFGTQKNNDSSIRIISEKSVVEPEVIVIQDKTLQIGETRVISPGKAGYEARVYREVLVADRVESRTMISSDYYKPENRIIHVGPKPKGLEK